MGDRLKTYAIRAESWANLLEFRRGAALRIKRLKVSAQVWAKRLAPYRQGNDVRSWFELLITLAAFGASWFLIYKLSFNYPVLAGLLIIPAAGFLVRLFMLQHDCGHNALFLSRAVNDWVGRFLSVFTLTPYDFWRHSHAIHHAGSGNLDRRGMGDRSEEHTS